MLSISDVSDADYYLRVGGSGCGGSGGSGGGEAEDMLAYLSKGEPPGEWLFVYRNDLGVAGEIHAEGESGDQFRRVLNHLCHPVNLTPLGRAPQKFRTVDEKVDAWTVKHPEATEEDVAAYRIEAEKHKAHAVHAWDMTFSPVKSISVAHAALEHEANRLHALAEEARAAGDIDAAALYDEESTARQAEADEVKTAIRVGIEAAMQMAADDFGVTRRGAAGPDIDGKTTMRHVPEPNLQCAIFTHHVSRDRDPQLHAHVMVLNRILCEDGQWRALFASGLLKSKHQLDAVFTRVMEAYLTARLGWRFAMRADGVAREVVGVSEEVRDLFSVRSRELGEAADRKIRNWAAERGIDNIDDVHPLIKWRLAQDANRDTRKKKLSPDQAPSRAEEVAGWDAAIAKEFHEGFTGVIDEIDQAARTPAGPSGFDPDAVIAQALADVTDRKGTFNRSHLMWAIDRYLPDMPGLSGEDIVALLRELTNAAVEGREVISLAAPSPIALPDSLINPQTGESVFEPPRGGRFTTRTHLEREDWLVKLLAQRGAKPVAREWAENVLAARGLSEQQFGVALEILCSENFIEIVNAAAGTGKSRLMAALSDASADLWGHGLTGFTASQNAAEVLAREGVHRAFNIAAFLTHHKNVAAGRATLADEARFAVPVGGTMVVDESSMVSTPDAVALLRKFIELGVGRVVFIGDTAQVDAVDAGGGFTLMTQHRTPHELTQVRRFANEWERDASQEVRKGELAGLHEYDKRGRIRGGGEPEDVEREAVLTVLDDMKLGHETVLVVGTGEKAAQLSLKIRAGLVRAGRVARDGLALHDDTLAGVGDLIQTRHNNRRLDVVNREVWRVEAVDFEAGTLTVSRSERDDDDRQVWGARRELPAEYVREQVELAYAATVQAVQGRTVDVGHLLVDDTMGRSRAYPGVTRGRERNVIWVPITRPARRHRESDEDYEARIPSALSAVVAAFEREDHTEAARSIIAAELARSENMGHLGPQWQQLIAEHREGDHRQLLREVVGEGHRLFSDLSLDGLLHLLRSAEHHGYDVRAVVERAYRQSGRLVGARAPASMLYTLTNRLLERDDVRPARTPDEADSYAERTPRGEGEIEAARAFGEVMDAREDALGEQVEAEAPAWAQALLGGVPADIVAREERREKVGIVAGYREMIGWRSEIDPIGPAPSRSQPELRWAWLRASRALGADPARDVTAASDAELANKVLAWRREQEEMPRNVDEDLRTTNEAADYARRQIVSARQRGEDPSQWVRMLAEQESRAKRLDQVDKGRRVAVAHTAEPRAEAGEALRELERRLQRDQKVASKYLEAERAKERARQEAADRDTRIHTAVGERWREQWVPDAPRFGSERWTELDDADPAKRAGLFMAAIASWRSGNRHNERELTERLETHGLDRVPEDPQEHMPRRVLERIREGMAEREARAAEPSGRLEIITATLRYAQEALRGDAPEFGSEAYADAEAEAKKRAEVREALRWWNAGDDLDERARRAEAAEEREAAAAISARVKAERDARVDTRSHREVVEARGEQPPEPRPSINEEPPVRAEPEPPARPDISWVRQAQPAERTTEPERKPAPEREPAEKVVREAPTEPDRTTPERKSVPDRDVTRDPDRDTDRDTGHESRRDERAPERERETAGKEPAVPREPQVRESDEERESATNEPKPAPERKPAPEPVERKPAPEPVVRKPEPEREKPAPAERDPKPAPERKPTPERVQESARTATQEPAKRDDLDEQLARSKATLERIAAEKAERETQQREAAQQREAERAREPEPVRTREAEAPQR